MRGAVAREQQALTGHTGLTPPLARLSPPHPLACSAAARAPSAAQQPQQQQFGFSLLLMPRATQVAERILEEQGVLGDVAVR